MIDSGSALGTHGEAGSYVFTDKAEAQYILIQMLDEAGVEVLYDTRAVLVKKDGDAVTGVVVVNKVGFCEVEAKQVIDATGDGDVCALAGVPFNFGATAEEVSEGYARDVGETQNFGTMYRVCGVDFKELFDYLEKDPDRYFTHEFGAMSYENAKESYNKGEMCVFRICLKELTPQNGYDHVQIYNLPKKDEAIILGPCCGYSGNGLDACSLSKGQHELQRGARALTEALKKIPGFETVKITYVPDAGVRETRHIIGDYVLSVIDVLSGKNFPDSIACGGHPLDIHPLPKEVENVDYNHWRFHIPYRIMLPKGVDNLLVTGRCVSASRGASGAIRPTAQCMAMGEAAGVAAALAVQNGTTPRNADVTEIRRILTDNGAVI